MSAIVVMALLDEMHAMVTVWQGTVFGMPACRADSRLTLLVLASWITVPVTTVSTRLGLRTAEWDGVVWCTNAQASSTPMHMKHMNHMRTHAHTHTHHGRNAYHEHTRTDAHAHAHTETDRQTHTSTRNSSNDKDKEKCECALYSLGHTARRKQTHRFL
jgi:hypothetical protein